MLRKLQARKHNAEYIYSEILARGEYIIIKLPRFQLDIYT